MWHYQVRVQRLMRTLLRGCRRCTRRTKPIPSPHTAHVTSFIGTLLLGAVHPANPLPQRRTRQPADVDAAPTPAPVAPWAREATTSACDQVPDRCHTRHLH